MTNFIIWVAAACNVVGMVLTIIVAILIIFNKWTEALTVATCAILLLLWYHTLRRSLGI